MHNRLSNFTIIQPDNTNGTGLLRIKDAALYNIFDKWNVYGSKAVSNDVILISHDGTSSDKLGKWFRKPIP